MARHILHYRLRASDETYHKIYLLLFLRSISCPPSTFSPLELAQIPGRLLLQPAQQAHRAARGAKPAEPGASGVCR